LIALNLSDQTQPLSFSQSLPTDIPMAEVLASTLLLANVKPSNPAFRSINAALAPNEGLVLQLKEKR